MSESTSTTYSQSSALIDYKKWNQLLYSSQLAIKIEEFRKWHKDLQTVNKAIQTFRDRDLLEKDIVRTRSKQKYMKKQNFLHLLRAIIVFYCTQNSVNYQQGLLQIAVPFVLLKSSQCKSRQCYGYFDQFMNRYFPALLSQKLVHNKRQLPMTAISLNFTGVLLNYLYPELYYHLKANQVPLSMIFTQELLTVFAKNLDLEVVYVVFQTFMKKCNQIELINLVGSSLNVLLLMGVALIALKQEKILEKQEEQIHMFLSKSLKTFTSSKDLSPWFDLYDSLMSRIPSQFYSHCQKVLNLTSSSYAQIQQGIKTQQVYQMMIQKEKQSLNYLIEIEDIKERQCIFLVCSCDKNIQLMIKNKKLVFILEKYIHQNAIISIAVNDFQSFIEQKQLQKQKKFLIVILIQTAIFKLSTPTVHFVEKFIEELQTKAHLNCMKMYEDNCVSLGLKNAFSDSSKRKHCALI